MAWWDERSVEGARSEAIAVAAAEGEGDVPACSPWARDSESASVPSTTGAGLASLPGAVVAQVFSFLSYADAMALSLTCKGLLDVGRPFCEVQYVCKNCGKNTGLLKKSKLRLGKKQELISTCGELHIFDEAPPAGVTEGETSIYRNVNPVVQCMLGCYAREFFESGSLIEEGLKDEEIYNELYCRYCRFRVGFKLGLPAHWKASCFDQFDDGGCREFLASFLDRYYFYKVFLEEADHRGAAIHSRGIELRCREKVDVTPGRDIARCNNLLGYSSDIISTNEHNWDIGHGTEKAMCMGRVEKESVILSNRRAEHLGIGAMQVQDMQCAKCRKEVGFKFEEAIQGESLHLEALVGQFCLVSSTVLEPIGYGDGYTLYPDFGVRDPTLSIINFTHASVGKFTMEDVMLPTRLASE